MLQGELDRVREDHQREFKSLESRIEESNSKHQEEVACFQKILKEREEDDRESERERERAKVSTEEVRLCLESQLETLRAELEATHKLKAQGIGELQESHQRELTETQQEVENLKEELAQKTLQHEDEMRALEEDCEIERERLLLLHEELTEQLALKGTAALHLNKEAGTEAQPVTVKCNYFLEVMSPLKEAILCVHNLRFSFEHEGNPVYQQRAFLWYKHNLGCS